MQLQMQASDAEPSRNRETDFDTDQVAPRVSRREDGILTQSARMLRFPAV
jgi:hypothetical protein